MAGPEGSSARPAGAPRPPRGPSTIVLVLSGPIGRADIPALCQRLGVLLEHSDAGHVVCDMRALVAPDAVTVDALARLQLTARRLGRQIRLSRACGELQELLAMVGLNDAVPPCSELPLEPGRQAEEREQVRGVEEEADPGDPTV